MTLNFKIGIYAGVTVAILLFIGGIGFIIYKGMTRRYLDNRYYVRHDDCYQDTIIVFFLFYFYVIFFVFLFFYLVRKFGTLGAESDADQLELVVVPNRRIESIFIFHTVFVLKILKNFSLVPNIGNYRSFN